MVKVTLGIGAAAASRAADAVDESFVNALEVPRAINRPEGGAAMGRLALRA
jgi:hypothetical protein